MVLLMVLMMMLGDSVVTVMILRTLLMGMLTLVTAMLNVEMRIMRSTGV